MLIIALKYDNYRLGVKECHPGKGKFEYMVMNIFFLLGGSKIMMTKNKLNRNLLGKPTIMTF